jgi:NAD(P)-dependent dehydrogenase (short-subunit alcohol dehydrogenase family)
MSRRLDGRVVLITGSTGIAAATAERAAAEGAATFIVSRTTEHARELASRTRGDFAVADLTDEGQVDTAVTAALDRYGRIDALFAAAGGSARRVGDGPIHAETATAWEAVADLNLRTQILTLARVTRAMRAQEPHPESGQRGSIVILGSVMAQAPVPELFGTHGYIATKGALLALTTAMAATYVDDRIRVNLVAPSLTRTPMAERAASDPHILEYAGRKQPLAGEMLDPDEVAKATLFFLSDDSLAVTGQHLAVDGGWSIVSTTATPTPKPQDA